MFKTGLFLFSPSPCFAGARSRRTRISAAPSLLTGHAEIKAAPDTAVVDLGVFSQGANAKAALEENTKNMAALMDVLKAAGIDAKDIQTSNFTVGPRYDNSCQPAA